MAALGEGIPLNQPVPKIYRAKKLGVYLAVLGCVLTVLIITAALIVKSRSRAKQQLAAATERSEPIPATKSADVISDKWKDSIVASRASETTRADPAPGATGSAPMVPVIPPSPGAPPPLMHRETMPSAVTNQPYSYQEPKPLSAKEQAFLAAYQEENDAIASPSVMSRNASSAPQATGLTLGAATPDMAAALQALRGAQGTADAAGPALAALKRLSGDSNAEDYGTQNDQEGKAAFAGSDRSAGPIVVPPALPPKEGCIVQAGWDIPAALEQSASSDLPGELRARVRENIYDSATGGKLCIPQHTILLGTYNSSLTYGQDRIQVKWTKMYLPNGQPVSLGNITGLDAEGKAGLAGKVNNHYKKLIGFALLSSAFSAGIQISQSRGNSSVLTYPSPGQVVGQAVGSQLGEFGRKVTERNLNRQPTVDLRAGLHFVARPDRDLVFLAPYQH